MSSCLKYEESCIKLRLIFSFGLIGSSYEYGHGYRADYAVLGGVLDRPGPAEDNDEDATGPALEGGRRERLSTARQFNESTSVGGKAGATEEALSA